MKVKGTCKKVYTRDVRGTTYYSVCVGGADSDGSDLWASCGKVKPSCSENDEISFTAIKDGKYWKVDPADITVHEGGGPTKVASKGGWNDPTRQKSIVAQSAFKYALDFVATAMENDALVLGSKTAKAPKKFEVLEQVIADKAREFYWIGLNPDEFFGEEPEGEDDEDEFNPVGE
jgi:hypothetical protein